MLVYRITNRKHSKDISGAGASRFGGRWNKKGTRVLYTGESKEISLLELIVHTPPLLIPKLDIVTLEIPGNSISILTSNDLPDNWYHYPAPTILSEIGNNWIKESKTVALRVPSCVIHSANNYILNCQHKLYSKVKIKDLSEFYFDPRLKL